MTKKSSVHFDRQRRLSKSSMPEMNGEARSSSRSSHGAKSPTRVNGNGSLHKSLEKERPGYDRTDTSASGWATENEDEESVSITYNEGDNSSEI